MYGSCWLSLLVQGIQKGPKCVCLSGGLGQNRHDWCWEASSHKCSLGQGEWVFHSVVWKVVLLSLFVGAVTSLYGCIHGAHERGREGFTNWFLLPIALSCAPLWSFDFIYKYLMGSNISFVDWWAFTLKLRVYSCDVLVTEWKLHIWLAAFSILVPMVLDDTWTEWDRRFQRVHFARVHRLVRVWLGTFLLALLLKCEHMFTNEVFMCPVVCCKPKACSFDSGRFLVLREI